MKIYGWLPILACSICSAQTTGTIGPQGDPANRIDLVIVGDGYTSAESGLFSSDANKFAQTFFGSEVYKEYAGYFNVRTIYVASNQSGASHPELSPPVIKDTAFGAAFNCSGIVRLICVNSAKLNAVITPLLPANQRDYVLVLVNDPVYGGSGGSILVSSTNTSAAEIILHESGHTIGLLADEYTSQPPVCSLTAEPSAANATLQSSRSGVKWNAWIDGATPVPTTTIAPGVPGIYEGADYCPSGKYRPTNNSRMRTLGNLFEPINDEQLVRRFYNIVSGIDASSPSTSPVSVKQGEQRQFSVTPLVPATHALVVSWAVDANALSAGPNLILDTSKLTVGTHSLVATVQDSTTFVRSDPAKLLTDTQTWQVSVGPPDALPIVAAMTITPSSLIAGATATVNFTLSGSALVGGLPIAFQTSNPVFPVPAIYTLQPGQTSGSFPVTASAALAASVTVTVTATFNGASRSASVTILPAPRRPSIVGVAGAALSVPSAQRLATGGLFSIFGDGFAPAGTSRAVNATDLVENALPANLAQTCVQVGSARAPLTFVSAGQINAQAPAVPAQGSVAVSVISGCGTASEVTSASVTVPVDGAVPEFLYFLLKGDGHNPVAGIQALTGSYLGAPGLITGSSFAPARSGDILTIFGVGFGPTASTAPAGTIATAAASTLGAASVTIGGLTAQVLYAGLSPGASGLYQVNVVVPANVPPGDQPIIIQVNGGISPAGPFLTIAQ